MAAFLLAAYRRRHRPQGSLPLQLVRSLHYCLPIIDEIVDTPIDPGYISYVQDKLIVDLGPFWPKP